MGFMDWFAKRMIERMTPQERYDLASSTIKEMITSMPPEERKEVITRLVPDALKTILDGMTPEERRDVVGALMPTVLLQLSQSGALSGIADLFRGKK
jgi:Mg/Co/Ni transporter MgtE